jgi:putative isomerase
MRVHFSSVKLSFTAALWVMLCALLFIDATGNFLSAQVQKSSPDAPAAPIAESRLANQKTGRILESAHYKEVQQRLAQGWNTWDVHSVTTHVLLPEGLAIRVGLEHNTTVSGDTFLSDALIGRLTSGAEEVFPGPHAWDGSYTDLHLSWKGHSWRIQSAHNGKELVLLARPLPSKPISVLPPMIVFSVAFLWNRPGTALRHSDYIETQGASGAIPIYCTCATDAHVDPGSEDVNLPVGGPYFAVDFTQPVGVSTGKRRTLAEIETVIERQQGAYVQSTETLPKTGTIVDAIETTLGWETIFEPEGQRVISPVSRVWSVRWGGYVLFDWDTFFAATLASVGDRDLAYADAIETLHEETDEGFVPNYARAGGWKSSDRSEAPVGSITEIPRPLVPGRYVFGIAPLEPLVGGTSRHTRLLDVG